MDIFKAVFERKLEEEKKKIEKEEKEKEQKKENKDNKDNKVKIDKKKQKKEYKIFYSPYGYIKVDKSELDKNEPVVKFIQYKPAPFKVESCIFGKISTLNYVKEINFNIKTFYNERKIYILEKIDIFSTLQLAIKKMFEQEKKEKEKNKEEDKDKDKDKDKGENNEEKKTEIDYEEERITEKSQYSIFF